MVWNAFKYTIKTQEIKSINIAEKFSLFEKLWTPHIIGELNGQYVKLCKLKDDFVLKLPLKTPSSATGAKNWTNTHIYLV